MSTSDLDRQFNTHKLIIQKAKLWFLCPYVFEVLHALIFFFREQEDEIHKGLAMQRSDFLTFLSRYRESMKSYILAENIPRYYCCF
jgi:hypothetical protein